MFLRELFLPHHKAPANMGTKQEVLKEYEHESREILTSSGPPFAIGRSLILAYEIPVEPKNLLRRRVTGNTKTKVNFPPNQEALLIAIMAYR